MNVLQIISNGIFGVSGILVDDNQVSSSTDCNLISNMAREYELTIVPANLDPLSLDVKIMALNVSVEILSSRFLQERHTGSPVVGSEIDVEKHSTLDNVYNVRVRGALWQIGDQNGSLTEFVILWTLSFGFCVVISTILVVESVRAIGVGVVIILVGMILEAVRISRLIVTSAGGVILVIGISTKGVVLRPRERIGCRRGTLCQESPTIRGLIYRRINCSIAIFVVRWCIVLDQDLSMKVSCLLFVSNRRALHSEFLLQCHL